MEEFFTWSALGTYAGATLAVTLITQLVKGVGWIEKLPTRITSYLVALVVLIAAAAVAVCVSYAAGILLGQRSMYDVIQERDRRAVSAPVYKRGGVGI